MLVKKRVLFVGAGGAVATKLLPELSRMYDIVGIAGQHRELEPYCLELFSGELTTSYARLFEEAFSCHEFDAIVWNVVRFHPMPLIETSRGTLHLEMDLAIALPLECLRAALARGFSGSFILVTSGLAFGVKPDRGSYSITKRGQVILAEYLAAELGNRVHAKAVALGAIADLSPDTLGRAFTRAIENQDAGTTVYAVYDDTWK